MAVNLFPAAVILSVTGSVGHILLKLLAAVSGNHLSQSWRYHGIVAVSLLFVLPVYKLWEFIPVPYSVSPPVISFGGGVEPAFLPGSPAGVDMLTPQPLPTAGIDWGTVLERAAVLWLWVAVSLVLWNVWRLLRYRRLIEQASNKVNSRLQQIAVEEAHLAGIRGEVRLLASPLAQSPMLIGFFRPTILLPSEQVPDSDARFILAHELTHFQRKDLWKKLLLLMVRCAHWFNPIVYLLNRDFSRWLETSCDEYVVSSLDRNQRKEYGRLLINYAPTSRYMGPKLYVSFTSCRYKLKRRILTMLNSNKKTRSLLGLALAVVLIVGCLATSAFAATVNNEEISGLASDMAVDSTDMNASVGNSADSVFGQTSDVALASMINEASIANASGESVFGTTAMKLSATDSADGYADVTASDIVLPTPRKSISLSAGKYYGYDLRYYEAGTVIDVYASWTPSNIGLQLGVYSVSADAPISSAVSGGQGAVRVTINQSGYFYIYAANTSVSQSANITIDYAY